MNSLLVIPYDYRMSVSTSIERAAEQGVYLLELRQGLPPLSRPISLSRKGSPSHELIRVRLWSASHSGRYLAASLSDLHPVPIGAQQVVLRYDLREGLFPSTDPLAYEVPEEAPRYETTNKTNLYI